MPFATLADLNKHFQKHGHKFGAISPRHYEQMAEEFMARPLNLNLHECISTSGEHDRIRIEDGTYYFGVICQTILRTFHQRKSVEVKMAGGAQAFVQAKCAEARG